jgi:hypothetical protein
MDFWKGIERSSAVIGSVCALVTVYYTMGVYYGWDKREAANVPELGATMILPWPIIILGGLAVLLLLSAWAMVAIRLRSKEPPLKSGSQTKDSPLPPVDPNQTAASVPPNKPLASLEFRFETRHAEGTYKLNAIVTATENMKNFVLIGTPAIAINSQSGSRWGWEPPARLLKPNDLFKGEIRESQILFCWGHDAANQPLSIFNRRPLVIEPEQLIMLRVAAICDAGTISLQRAYRIRRTGDVNTVDLIHDDDIAYISGANIGL